MHFIPILPTIFGLIHNRALEVSLKLSTRAKHCTISFLALLDSKHPGTAIIVHSMMELVLHYWVGWVLVCYTEQSKLRDMVIEVSQNSNT